MNLQGDAFFEPDRVAILADTYASSYQDASIGVTKLPSWMTNQKITNVTMVHSTIKVRYKQILSMGFNNSKLSFETMMSNHVSDVKLRATPLQYIDVVIDNVNCKLCATLGSDTDDK